MMEHIPLFDRISTKVPCTQIIIDDEEQPKPLNILLILVKKELPLSKNLITLMFPKEDSKAT
jgi:hypothetical protein